MMNNIGLVDKIIRLIVGAILIAPPFVTRVYLFPTSVITIASVVTGALIMATALINVCPLYRVVGVRTSGIAEK